MMFLAFLVGQISLWGSQTYPGATNVSPFSDFTGDGVTDVVATYTDTTAYALDSLVLYDALTLNRLGTYALDPGYTSGYLLPLPGTGRVLFVEYDYTYPTYGLRFRVYESFTQPVFTSPDFTADRSVSLWVGDFTGDGSVDIVVSLVNTATGAEVRVYTTPWTGVAERTPQAGETRKDVFLRRGSSFPLPGAGRLVVLNPEGRKVLDRDISGVQEMIPVNLPPGVYIYTLEQGTLKGGRLWVAP